MYEDRTYENIMAEMMADVPNGIDTSVGSFFWHACSKMGMLAEDVYGTLEDIYANQMIDTADLDHLIAYGAECGCPIEEATAATFKAQFNMAIEAGTEIEAITDTDENMFTFTVQDCLDETNHIYSIECETDGIEPNSFTGSVDTVDYTEGFEGSITELINPGTDEEDEETYRYRLLNFFEIKPFAGNLAYYKSAIDALTGVGGCKAKRAETAGGNISVVIISSDYKAPTSDLITTVQTAVDPASGSGEGIAPVGAKVTITGVEAVAVNITATVSYDTGKTYADLKSYIEAAVDAYFTELSKSWESSDTAITVRISQIELRLLNIDGIIDVENITLNGATANLILGENKIPIRGTIVC